MLKQLQKLDRKLGTTLEQIDRAAQPLKKITTFEVFQKADEEQEKASYLLHVRQEAAGMDYQVPNGATAPVELQPQDERCTAYPACQQLEHSRI